MKEIFKILDNPELTVVERKLILKSYLQEKVRLQSTAPEQSESIAYEIAGLLATDLAHKQLTDDDPYILPLTLAGELELPKAHQGNATWEAFRESVKAL